MSSGSPARLGDIAEFVMGQAPPGADCNKAGRGHVFVKAGEFDERRPLVREWTTNPLKFARRGDVLVCVVGATAGKINEAIDCAIGRSVAAVRPNAARLLTTYLYHFLSTQVMRLRAKSQGLAQGVITREMLHEIVVPLPPLPEQRRIAEVLDRAEALRAKRRAALAQLDTLTQSIFLDMFGDPATNPKGWPLRTLGELIVVGPQNGLYKPADDYGTGTPMLRIDSFYDGAVTNLATLKRVRLSQQEQELYALREDEIVINRVNSPEYLGKSAVIPTLREPTVFESNMMRFDVDREVLHPHYLIEYLQSRFVRAHILRSAKDAVNQSSINQQDVKAIPVVIPPLSTQRLFAQRVAATDRLRDGHGASRAELEVLFASLQHRAFRGEL